MAHRHDSHAHAHMSPPTFPHLSPQVTFSDRLLSATIPLPIDSRVAFATYVPVNICRPHEALDHGRRQLISRNQPLSFHDSIFAHTHIDSESSALHAFVLSSVEAVDDCLQTLRGLSIDGLKVSEVSSFSLRGIYPCSSACSDLLSPCSDCMTTSASLSDPAFSAANLLPRKPLRTLYSRLLEAIRTRLIDDITEASKSGTSGVSAHRLTNGFLLASSSNSSEWGTDWLQGAKLRPLVHCRLEIHIATSRLEIYTHFRPTDFLPLEIMDPPVAGTPITLLPFGVPAYYLSIYAGPTSAVTSQFEQSLTGLGAGEWKAAPAIPESESRQFLRPHTQRQRNPVYVIAWLAVQNKQGEDKGIPIIWPSRLCVSFTATSLFPHARRSLSHIPDISAQLLPSPQLPAPPSISVDSVSIALGRVSGASSTPILPGFSLSRRICTSPTSGSLRAFRCINLPKSSRIDTVASEVSAYIESVAREREKERERIRREREAQLSASPKALASPIATPTAIPPSTCSNMNLNTSGLPVTVDAPHISAGTQDTNLLTANNFYPSPPSTDGKSTMQSIGPVMAPIVSPIEPPASSIHPDSNVFDSVDSPWSQSTTEFMNMGMAYEMHFDLNGDAITSGSGGGNGTASRLNIDFEDGFTFTDDDFNFFDRPPSTAPALPSAIAPPSRPIGSRVPPSMPGDECSIQNSQNVVMHNVSSTSTVTITPRTSDFSTHESAPPGVGSFPSPSRGVTTPSHSIPPMPSMDPFSQQHLPLTNPLLFDPILFTPCYKVTDAKYEIGKFALPSPPGEETCTDRHTPPPQVCASGWGARYRSITNPREGVVKRLRGVKRKSFGQGRPRRPYPSWLHEDEDDRRSPKGHVTGSDDADSEVPSDGEEPDMDSSSLSRPTTPPPTYLPTGPSLLHMQFHHPYLLPLSEPLRPPGAAVAPMSIPVVTTSVPTPVSPAAALGAASEKSKSLEAAGSIVAREVVENNAFSNAWRANKVHSFIDKPHDIWPMDVFALAKILDDIHTLSGPAELLSFLGHGISADSEQYLLQRLEPPLLAVGKNDSIVQLLPSSLRFWEKLGLTPRAGRKDVTAYLVLEDGDPSKQRLAEAWLTKISVAYNARHLGTHALGTNALCSSDGILPLRLDSLRKSLTSFINGLPATMDAFVIYIALPNSALSLACPLFRQLLSTIKRLQRCRPDNPVLFHLIPELFITAHYSHHKVVNLDTFCFSLYHRLALPVEDAISRKIAETDETPTPQTRFQEPPFIISRPQTSTVRFSHAGSPFSLDVFDRHTFLHVGYRFSSCGKWLLASCTDQRGESHDVGCWLTQEEAESSATVQIWNFATQFARKANVEWRFVITKLGVMSASELDSWIHHLSASVPLRRDLPPFHITVLSVDHSISWSILQNRLDNSNQLCQTPRRSSNRDTKSIYVDLATATTYAIYPTVRIPLPTPEIHHFADVSFVPDTEGVPVADPLPLLPISTTVLLHASQKQTATSATYPTLHIHLLYTLRSHNSSLTTPDDVTHQEITQNYHELTVLAYARQQHSDHPLLPLHLAALETMHEALRQEETE